MTEHEYRELDMTCFTIFLGHLALIKDKKNIFSILCLAQCLEPKGRNFNPWKGERKDRRKKILFLSFKFL
jgi:hypothetical protein